MTIYNILAAEVVFISKPIEVEKNPDNNLPEAFYWKGNRKKITTIVSAWQDWNYPAGAVKRNWRARRHRNYYRVECDDNKIYEIYLDRQTVDKPTWYLYRIIKEG
ncbi:MAG: hypothetical protein J7K40_02055 [candidate division Zixibacteria bacterium]|nr:hypothetical protein [candidate division Zixibacteria bacterium]